MGQEIVYCFKCLTRLSGADFERGTAVRHGHRIACKECAPDLLAGLGPEEKQELLEAGRKPDSRRTIKPPSTARIPSMRNTARAEAAPRGAPWIWPAVVGGTLAALAGAALLFSFKPAPPAPAAAASPPPVSVETPRHRAVREAVERAGRASGDLDSRIAAWEEAMKAARETPHFRHASEAHEALVRKREGAREKELADFLAQADRLASDEQFGRALEHLEQGRGRIEAGALERKAREMRRAAEELFASVKASPKPSLERVARWGLPEYQRELERRLSPAPPRAVSAEAAAYRSAWEQAMARATARDFGGAAADLERAAKDAAEEPVRREAAQDAADLRGMAALLEEALKSFAAAAPGASLSLEAHDGAGGRRRVEGRLVSSGPARLEVIQRGDARAFVDLSDLTAAALADRLKPSAAGARLLRLWRLLEGDAVAGDVPEKYLDYSKGAAAKLPRLPAREAEARALFHEADAEFRAPETLAHAVGKYRKLAAEYGETRIVRGEAALVRERAAAAREHAFGPSSIAASGGFRMGKAEKVEACWTSSADAEGEAARANHLEFRFPALAETPYRCWIYAGGCCAETFELSCQATELAGPNPKKRSELLQAPPDGPNALPLPHGLRYLKPTHASHLGPKQPSRWGWIEVKLPKYAEPGLKTVRILSGQKGFSVAFAVVSATRKDPPSDAELKEELAKATAKPPAPPVDPRPWRPVFDGKSVDCLVGSCRNDWRVENGAIVKVPGTDNAAQSGEDFGDAEIRVRFETKADASFAFRVRQGAEGVLGVVLERAQLAEGEGRPRELLFTCRGDSVTAALDGKPVSVDRQGNPLRGRLQFHVRQGEVRILAIDARDLP